MNARLDAVLARHRLPLADADAQDELWAELVAAGIAEAPFDEQWAAWQRVFEGRPATARPPAAYRPTTEAVARANVTALARAVGAKDHAALHTWSTSGRAAFWERAIAELDIPFKERPRAILEGTAEDPKWLPGARLNIADACFHGADATRTAIVHAREGESAVRRISYAELEGLVDRVSHGFARMGLHAGDAVALYMPMTVECVAAYLGIVRAGGVVVGIADSFAPPEVAARLRIGQAKAVVTTGAFVRAGKTIDLYAKAREASAPRAILVGGKPERDGDLAWEEFLGNTTLFNGVPADPYSVTNVLFSSGTTGDPKAIPWTHLTPIKAAVDGRYHHDIKHDDVVAWPTSMGWMMGPWLVYAALMNGATLALFEGAAASPGFVRFAREARVSVLGVVPALVRAWRSAGLVKDEFRGVRVFTSTGEASNVEDSLWLMSRAGYRAPIIEYCGGTEIGGGHVTGTVVQPQSPATFSTPALGIDLVVLGEDGKPVGVGEMGELFIVPPSIGLSQRLLNADHHKVYYEGAPRGPHGETLRRHGDEVQRLGGGYWQAHGRADDTMNLGGIKVSSIELERAMDKHPDVYQTAAVAWIPPGGGAERLVVFVVAKPGASVEKAALQNGLQEIVKRDLNPLYKIHDVVLVETLPRTASNKIMRRELRKRYTG